MKYLTLALAILTSSQARAFDIHWTDLPHQQVTSHCAALTNGLQNLAGCQYWHNNTCIVVAPNNVQKWAIRRILSHEIKHCFVGSFHKPNENGDESDLHLYRPLADELIERR